LRLASEKIKKENALIGFFVLLSLSFWITGLALDSKLESRTAEGFTLAGAFLLLATLAAGACVAHHRHFSAGPVRVRRISFIEQRLDGDLDQALMATSEDHESPSLG